MSEEVSIGYWGSNFEKGLPMPVAGTPRVDQAKVIDRLKVAMKTGHLVSYRGWSNCRLCGKQNGSRELEIIRGSTKYRIPEGYVHYLEDHGVGYADDLLSALRSMNSGEVDVQKT